MLTCGRRFCMVRPFRGAFWGDRATTVADAATAPDPQETPDVR
jgi:hypothetical protein